MTIQVTCPSCQSAYQLSDGLQGKNVRCKKCGEVFRIGVVDAPPSSPVVLRPADEPSSIQSSPAPRPTSRPAVASRMADEDYGPPPKRKGSSTAKILLIVFGSIAAVFLVICGGVVGLGYWATKATREKFEEIHTNVEERVIDARSAAAEKKGKETKPQSAPAKDSKREKPSIKARGE